MNIVENIYKMCRPPAKRLNLFSKADLGSLRILRKIFFVSVR